MLDIDTIESCRWDTPVDKGTVLSDDLLALSGIHVAELWLRDAIAVLASDGRR